MSNQGLITNGKYWTTECIRHPKRRLCTCCPNGMHIDVDFDIFYKTLTKMQRNNVESPTKQFKYFKRKQEPTFDALLGSQNHPTSNIDEIVYKSRDMPAKASPDVQESLEQALHDFEETLIRSCTTDSRSPITSPLLSNHFSSSLSLRSDTKSDYTYKPINGEREKYVNGDINFTTTTTQSTATMTVSPKKPQFKETGINCSVITRDVGTNYSLFNHVNVATNTSLDTTDSQTMTELSSPEQPRRKFSLTQIFNDAKKSNFTSVGTQTFNKITLLEIIEKRDTGIQTEPDTRTECTLKNIFDGKYKRNRSVATSTQDLPNSTPHSSGLTQLQTDLINLKRTYSKYCQTKDVIVKENVLCTKRGCQTDQIPVPRTKESGVNTIKKKLVDASTETSFSTPVLCEKCQTSNLSNLGKDSPLSVSKIPRPKSIPIAPHNRKKLMRQDTYVKIPAQDEQIKKSDIVKSPESKTPTSDSRSQNEFAEETFFQPISDNKIKAEPSTEMKAAMKVLNDSLHKPTFSKLKQTTLKNAISVIQQEWFKISSLSIADPLVVEDYLDAIEEISTSLLEYVVNMRDGAGNTAMHYAVSHGNFDVVSILLDSKVCDINVVNDAGYTCIMLVSLAEIKSSTHCDVIRRLFQMADINLKAKKHGQTTLMLAASHGKLDVVNLLLECGADVNIQDDDGSTALMCAAEHGYLDIVNALSSHPECDLTIKDNDGSNALTIAMEAGHREIGIALYARQHFADMNSNGSKEKRSRSANPILMEHRTRTPSLKSTPSSPSAAL
ncbi:uncharacterized protein Kank isoform X2 [Planococcus citri]|uniref:uncharacterized protein Kank isoform X2 n=1 Tax=Planococcus citri TaxID=170843 RepID=UPI0031FA0F34